MDKIQRHERRKFRKRKAGRAEMERMMNEFPHICVYWKKGNVDKREFCDLRRAAGIVRVYIEEIFDNLRWGGGNWETNDFQIQVVSAETWWKEVAKQKANLG